MATEVTILLDMLSVSEGSQLGGVANFRDKAAGTASIPATAEYKVYDVERRQVITDWTSLGTAAARMAFTLDKDDLALTSGQSDAPPSHNPSYRRMLIVIADRGLATQAVAQKLFRVTGISSFIS